MITHIKIKFFSNISLENQILTWDKLGRTGFMGPNVCVIFKLNEECMEHLFGNLTFFQVVWKIIINDMGVSFKWDLQSLEINV